MAAVGDHELTRRSSPLLVAFGVAAVVHLTLLAADAGPWDTVTKCLLAPLLAAWTIQHGGPRLLVVALGFCTLGDFFMDVEALFVAGMAAFAAAHVCLVTLYARRGAFDRVRRSPWLALVYLVAAVVLVVWCLPGFEPGVQPLVPVYALLLAATATTAAAVDRVAGIGALLFLLSDGLIAASVAGRVPDGTVTSLAIMVLYIGAIAGITVGTRR